MNRQFLELMTQTPRWVWYFLRDHISRITGNTLGFLTIILLHLASMPTLMSVLLAQSDKLPPADLMVFIWSALTTLFFKSMLERNLLYVATICIGFVAQTLVMGLILFR